MKLNKDDLMKRIKERIGDDTSDEAMSFIEDLTDTINDYEQRATGTSEEEWQKKYNDLDNSWREKYKNRFFNNVQDEDEDEYKDMDVKETDKPKMVSFDQLFTKEEK